MGIGENYWSLHRNSLITSSLLFLTSINAIRIDQTQFWHIQETGKLVQFLLFLISSYAFIVYLNSARPQFSQHLIDELRNISGNQSQLEAKLLEFDQMIRLVEQQNRNCLGSISGLCETLKGEVANECGNIYPQNPLMLFSENTDQIQYELATLDFGLSIANSGTSTSEHGRILERRQAEIANRIQPLIEELALRAFRHSSFEIRKSLLPYFEQLKGDVELHMNTMKKYSEELSKFNSESNGLSRSIRRRILFAKIGAFFSGWQIPTIIYTISVFHFLGLYWSIFYSAIDILKFLKMI